MRRTYQPAWSSVAILMICVLFSACRSAQTKKENLDGLKVETMLLGEFEDDYGARYTITKTLWHQQPGGIYHVDYWNSDDAFVILQNDETNGSNPGLWTRIDWTLLKDVEPYDWGFCLTVYDAPTSTEAAAAAAASRDTPMTGCNGFPFTRMKRLEPAQKRD